MKKNPLATTRNTKRSNPLAQPMRQSPGSAPAMSPLMAHAKMWQTVNQMPSDQMAQSVDKVDYILPVLGKLAADPKVTAKDVIKAVADAAADNQIEPSEGISFIQQIPQNAEDIRPWLKGLYALNMTGAVHMKAAMMQQGGQTAPGGMPGQPATSPTAAPGMPA